MSKNRVRRNETKTLMRDWKPVTKNQYEYVISMCENILTVGSGVAGCGKSYVAIAKSIQDLISGTVDKILITRPMISAGNNSRDFPSLPGQLDEKIQPYMLPYIDYLEYFLDRQRIKHLVEIDKIELTPMELLRGRTYGSEDHPTVMILEEAQNCTPKQIKLFLSRLGKNSRAVIVGDEKQSDLDCVNGLDFLLNILNLNDLDNVGIIRFNYQDIQRNKIIGHILEKFEQNGC